VLKDNETHSELSHILASESGCGSTFKLNQLLFVSVLGNKDREVWKSFILLCSGMYLLKA